MEAQKSIGVIALDANSEIFRLDNPSTLNGYHVKKVWMSNSAEGFFPTNYPTSEIVADRQSIINDQSINLVIVSKPLENDLDLLAEMLAAGKQVRVI